MAGRITGAGLDDWRPFVLRRRRRAIGGRLFRPRAQGSPPSNWGIGRPVTKLTVRNRGRPMPPADPAGSTHPAASLPGGHVVSGPRRHPLTTFGRRRGGPPRASRSSPTSRRSAGRLAEPPSSPSASRVTRAPTGRDRKLVKRLTRHDHSDFRSTLGRARKTAFGGPTAQGSVP